MTYPFVAGIDYGPRKGPALAFCIHMAEGGNTVNFLKASNTPPRGVSVHYVIETTGRIVQMVKETSASGSINPNELRTDDDPDRFYGVTARQAVMGAWDYDPNSAVLSVEIEGFAAVGPNAAQHGSLKALVADIRSRYPDIRLLGHRDFTNTKACPGKLIHWSDLGGHGEEPMKDIDVSDATPKIVDVPKGAKILNPDGSARLTAPNDRLNVLSPFGTTSDGGTALRAILWTSATAPTLLLAMYGNAVVNPRPVTTDCADAVAAEHERTRSAAIKAVEAI